MRSVDAILGSLKSGQYDKDWYYFSTRYQINLYLDGRVQTKLNDYTRHRICEYAWESHVHKRGYQIERGGSKRFYEKYGIEPPF